MITGVEVSPDTEARTSASSQTQTAPTLIALLEAADQLILAVGEVGGRDRQAETARQEVEALLPCRWQASPSLGGWPPPNKCNEAESGSLALGLAPSLSGKDHFLLPLESQSRDRPAPRVRLPCT